MKAWLYPQSLRWWIGVKIYACPPSKLGPFVHYGNLQSLFVFFSFSFFHSILHFYHLNHGLDLSDYSRISGYRFWESNKNGVDIHFESDFSPFRSQALTQSHPCSVNRMKAIYSLNTCMCWWIWLNSDCQQWDYQWIIRDWCLQSSALEFVLVSRALDRLCQELNRLQGTELPNVTSTLLRQVLLEVPDLLNDVGQFSSAISEKAAR